MRLSFRPSLIGSPFLTLLGAILLAWVLAEVWESPAADALAAQSAGPVAAASSVVIPLDEALRARCLSVLRRGLASDQFWPAMHAAEALTLAGQGSDVLDALPARLQVEQDDQRRCGLARELVRAGDRRQIQVLLDILADRDSTGRVHAAESLYKVAEVGNGELLREAMRSDDNPRLQLMAAAALARCGHPEALPRIRAQLNSQEEQTRMIAAWILGLLGDGNDVLPLTQALSRAEDATARAFIHNALASLGDPGGQAVLRKNLDSEDPAIRTYAAEFAGYGRVAEARDQLIAQLDDENLDARIRAAQSLILLSQAPVEQDEVVTRDVFVATPENPRYSEGSVVTLTDGTLVYATTEFVGGGADHATAQIVEVRSRDLGRSWSSPRVLQENVGRQNVMSVTLRRLQPGRHDGPIGLFYLVKNSPEDLHVFLRVSTDEMRTWGEPRQVTSRPGYHVMNNDRVTVTSHGRILCPVAWTANVSQGGHFVSLCHYSDDGGDTWRKSADQVDEQRRGAMEPEIIELTDGRLMMIIRTQMGYIATSYSEDGGDHWSEPERLDVTAPEAPSTIRRIPSTGHLLLIWNNTFQPGSGHGGRRWPLTAAISRDEGRSWEQFRNLDAQAQEAYAYTSVEFVQDRAVITYYVHDEESGRISSRLKSLPIGWFYDSGVRRGR